MKGNLSMKFYSYDYKKVRLANKTAMVAITAGLIF